MKHWSSRILEFLVLESSDAVNLGDIAPEIEEFCCINQGGWGAELKLSNSWLDSMKAQISLKQVRRHGEGQSVSINHANQERTRLQKPFCDFLPKDI